MANLAHEMGTTEFGNQLTFDFGDWEITNLFKDTVLIQFVDAVEEDGDEEYIKKDEDSVILIPASKARDFFRLGKVVLAGPDCSEFIKPGTHVIVPPAMGLRGLKKVNGRKTVFIREEQIMCVVDKPNKERQAKKYPKFFLAETDLENFGMGVLI